MSPERRVFSQTCEEQNGTEVVNGVDASRHESRQIGGTQDSQRHNANIGCPGPACRNKVLIDIRTIASQADRVDCAEFPALMSMDFLSTNVVDHTFVRHSMAPKRTSCSTQVGLIRAYRFCHH